MLFGRAADGCVLVADIVATAGQRWFVAVPVLGRIRDLARHDVLQLRFVNRLVPDERISHDVEFVAVIFEDLLGERIVRIDDMPHFLVDRVRGLVRNLLVLGDRAAKEDFAVVLAVGQRTELVGQAPTW